MKEESVKLFCLPYAGGRAAIYNKWQPYFPDFIELIPIELAGRGNRICEDFYSNIGEAVDDIIDIISPEIDHGKYAFFGHSMGAHLSFAVAQKIKLLNWNEPIHLFCSGKGDPFVKRKKEELYHLLNEAEFKEKIKDLGGTPPDFFEHPELLDLFLPLLRNDFRLASNHSYFRKNLSLNSDITTFAGRDDDIPEEEIYGWRNYFKGNFYSYFFDGGHFFINEVIPETAAIIKHQLQENLY